MKIDTLLGGKMISTYEYREGFIGSDAYKTYAPPTNIEMISVKASKYWLI